MVKQRTAGEWQQLINAWRAGGQTKSVFCREQKIPLTSFSSAQRRLKKQVAAQARTGFVRLNLSPQKHPTYKGFTRIELDFCTIQLNEDAVEKQLLTILKAIKEVSKC